MDIGPVKFSVEGTFTEKPRLLMDGQEVEYDALYISHTPEFDYEDYDGSKKSIAASTRLDFSVKANIGQLEANVMYRVKANEQGNFVLAKSDENYFEKTKKDKMAKDKKGGDDKKADEKEGDEKKSKKPPFKKKDDSKADITPDPGSSAYKEAWRRDLEERLAK